MNMELNERLTLIIDRDQKRRSKEPVSQEKMINLITRDENSFYWCLVNLVAIIGGKPRRDTNVISTAERLIKSFQQRICEVSDEIKKEELAAAVVVSYFNDPGIIVRAMIEYDVRKEEEAV
jgi:hypothetical protein